MGSTELNRITTETVGGLWLDKGFGRAQSPCMKVRVAKRKLAGLTLTEVVVIIAVLALLAAMLLPALAAKRSRHRFNCVNNLREVGLYFRLWAGDNGDNFPMQISVKQGGAMELVATGNVVAVFQVMTNELGTPKILRCPDDLEHLAATNFNSNFTAKNLSYFVGLNVQTNSPKSILGGDANFERGGRAVVAGVYQIDTNAMIFWSPNRHNRRGNLVLADGSVQFVSNSNLVLQFIQTGLATNRLAIP
jgi:prepilin-type processing-associated H-X9-DG protein